MIAALPWIGAGVILLVVAVMLGRPLLSLGRLALRSVAAFALLYLIQPLGLGLGANGVNALVLAVLGAPGLGLLLLLPWALG